jgi:hypothetical protein
VGLRNWCDGEDGVLISPDSNGALLQNLRELLSSSVKRGQLAAGAKRNIERYRSSQMLEQTEAVLQVCTSEQ